ncbi:MAG: hypothetical protein AAF394_07635 [Planctomycetota bacterium]
MPIARDARNNRRRRVLRDQAEETSTQRKGRKTRQSEELDESDEKLARRSAGYSQEVRRACGARLVQMIPVRKSSYTALVFVSLLIPCVLLLAHYMIYVSGSLVWYGHPLATMLDASHPRSIAAWLGSNIWLLCLGVTLLTFQLRKHKLDDYDGEYRLWFWMVLTCVLASMDATTRFTELLGLALNSWSQQTLGWSGPAVVTATLATLVGLLGLRLCTELKTVPTSLVFWLVGLVSWAGSAALAQEELRLEISLQLRIWLKVSLWLGGLTAIWLSAVTYLRSVYIEAQQRFLARRKLAQKSNLSFRERVKASLPSFRRDAEDSDDLDDEAEGSKPSRWRLPSFARANNEDHDADENSESSSQETARAKRKREREELAELRKLEKEEKALEQQAAKEKKARRQKAASQPVDSDDAEASTEQEAESTRSGWRKLIPGGLGRKRSPESEDEAKADVAETRSSPAEDSSAEGDAEKKRSKWTSWIRAPKVGEDAEEYHKVPRGQGRRAKSSENDESTEEAQTTLKKPRSWFGLRKSATGEEAQDQPENDQEENDRGTAKPRKKGFFSRFTLQPPEEDSMGEEASPAAESTTDFLPPEETTATQSVADASFDEPERPNRPLSKAERKRLRRQQKNRAA